MSQKDYLYPIRLGVEDENGRQKDVWVQWRRKGYELLEADAAFYGVNKENLKAWTEHFAIVHAINMKMPMVVIVSSFHDHTTIWPNTEPVPNHTHCTVQCRDKSGGDWKSTKYQSHLYVNSLNPPDPAAPKKVIQFKHLEYLGATVFTLSPDLPIDDTPKWNFNKGLSTKGLEEFVPEVRREIEKYEQEMKDLAEARAKNLKAEAKPAAGPSKKSTRHSTRIEEANTNRFGVLAESESPEPDSEPESPAKRAKRRSKSPIVSSPTKSSRLSSESTSNKFEASARLSEGSEKGAKRSSATGSKRRSESPDASSPKKSPRRSKSATRRA